VSHRAWAEQRQWNIDLDAGPSDPALRGTTANQDVQAKQLLATASNYLSASAYLLRNPQGSDDATLRLIDRAAILIREATTLINLVKRSDMSPGEIKTSVSVRVLIEKASNWLISPDGSGVNLTVSVGQNAGFVACEPARIIQALESILAEACVRLNGQSDRQIQFTTRRIDGQIEMKIEYQGGDLSDLLRQGLDPKASGSETRQERSMGRSIVEEQGGRIVSEVRAPGTVTIRMFLPAAR
jgi:hypothetical protein